MAPVIAPDNLGDVDQLREAPVDAVDVDSDDDLIRTIGGIGVPFDQIVDVEFGQEMFAGDCVFDDLERALLFYRHDEPVGRLVESSRDEAGLRVRLNISRTPRGDEAYTLARDGVLDRLSIRFRPVEWLMRDDGVIVHTRVQVREFSLVPFPAYPGAVVDEVRRRPDNPTNPTERTTANMTDTLTRAQLDEALGEQRRDLDAAMARALAEHNAGSGTVYGEQWRSAGEFLRAIADNDTAAHDFYRAYTGGKFADSATPANWIGDAIKLVDERRKVLNIFNRQTLPDEGMTLEYAKLATNTIVVAEQAAEGDDLTFGKVTLTTANAAVKTYGGYTTLSLPEIQRSRTPILDTHLQAMDIAYARTTELAARAQLAALVTAQRTAGNKIVIPDLSAATVFAWLDAIVDAAELADDRGFVQSGLLVGKDVFKTIYRLADSHGDPLMSVTGTGVNRVGTLHASALSASLADVQVELVPGAAPLFGTFYDPTALTTWEQPGAPMQLQDDNIINLSRSFSKYGSAAIGSQYPTALVPLEFTAA